MMVYVALATGTSRRSDPVPTARPGMEEAWRSLSFLDGAYPDFRAWYWGSVVPGIATGERRLFCDRQEGRLSGLVIAKRADERKLCTIWTHPCSRGQGIATRLVRDALGWLGTDHPLVTVSDETIQSFDGLFRRFGFEHRQAMPGYYRDGSVEHVFNGVLRPARAS